MTRTVINLAFCLFSVSTLVDVLSATSFDGRQLCSHCKERDNFTECNRYLWCERDEKCMTSQYITSSGATKYYTGCVSKRSCDDLEKTGTEIPLDDLTVLPKRILVQRCCDGQGCNGFRNDPRGRSLCMKCDTTDLSDCDTAELCNDHHECLYHEHFDVTPRVEIKYSLTCQDRNVCRLLNGTGSCHSNKRDSTCSGNINCCTGDFCNLFYGLRIKNLTSNLLVAGSVHIQSPTFTTTASIPKTTPVTSQTACYTGQNTVGAVTYCTGSTPYCLNNLTNYYNGYREVSRGCGSESECFRLSYISAQKSTGCDLFNEDILYRRDFSCTYCCDKDKCNGRVVPPPETMYIPVGTNNQMSFPRITRDLYDQNVMRCGNALGDERCQKFLCPNEHLARIYCRKYCNLCS